MTLTVSEAERDLREAVAAGAAGDLLKTTPVDEVEVALIAAKGREPVFSPSLAALVLGEFRQMAKTAENHVRNSSGKLHLSRRSDLVHYAEQHGLDWFSS